MQTNLQKMNRLKQINNIVFDLGNVLVPLDFPKFKASIKKIADPTTKLTFEQLSKKDEFLAYETGQMSTPEFLSFLKITFHSSHPITDLANAWNSLIGPIPYEHINLLRRLGKEYRLFLLSNTNDLHARLFERMVPEIPNLRSLFERVYYSHEEKLRKPQKELFQRVLDQNNLSPEQTLFADDMEENCLSASSLGIQTLQVTPEINLPQWFSAMIHQ